MSEALRVDIPADGGETGLATARVDHVGLNVADLRSAVAWYTSVFELTEEFRFRIEDIDFEGVILISPAGDRIELISRPGARPGMQASSPVEAALTYGYSHFALRVPDVQAAYDWLISAGATDRLSPRPSPDGGPFAFVADPEGNLIELLNRD
jgi:catechol 2,3-dioxygenase-like lactoylglutathione lyase family enzyme